MNCNDVLPLLLEAELDELAAVGEGPVARHLRGCARCRRVGAALRADTLTLGARAGAHAGGNIAVGLARCEPGPRQQGARRTIAAVATVAAAAAVLLVGSQFAGAPKVRESGVSPPRAFRPVAAAPSAAAPAATAPAGADSRVVARDPAPPEGGPQRPATATPRVADAGSAAPSTAVRAFAGTMIAVPVPIRIVAASDYALVSAAPLTADSTRSSALLTAPGDTVIVQSRDGLPATRVRNSNPAITIVMMKDSPHKERE